MSPWSGYHIAETIIERRRRYSDPMRNSAALASTIRHWLTFGRPRLLAPPPMAGVLQANRELAMQAVKRLLSDPRPRKDDLRRALFLVEAR